MNSGGKAAVLSVRAAFALFWGLLFLPSFAGGDTNVGNIAVIEADPTILQPGEPFDLNNRTLTFTPRAGGGYTVSAGALAFDTNLGTNLGLADEGFVQVNLGFTFPFFALNRTSVFVNSNGYVTLGGGSSFVHFNGQSGGSVSTLGDASTVLDRIAEGFPRIAVLWQDWDPSAAGGVFVNSLSDRVIVTWNAVPFFGTTTTATFQVVLFSTGVVQMNYQSVTTTPGGGYLAGVSPGASSQILTTTVDLNQGGSSISSFPNFEPLVQVFGTSSSPLVHINAVARRFFRTHGDDFDQLVMFANFTNAMGSAFAFELAVRQTVSGGGQSLFDISSFFGSVGRLQSFLNMNRLSLYPSDPNTTFLGTNNTLDLMGQESGHMWLAFPKFDNGGVCSDLLLGRDLAHWSYFLDSDASDMEGNKWQDNGDGTFTTIEATARFSALDQYIMGLRSSAEVPTFFFINNPTNTGGKTRSSAPQTGVTVNGTRQNVTVGQIQTCEGARSPSSGFSAVNATTTWKQAFVLLIQGGSAAPNADVTKIDTIRTAWQSYFSAATGGRGTVNTTLPVPQPTVSIDDVNIAEGNTGMTNAVFTVMLSSASSQPVTVTFSTANGTAVAGSDYVSQSGSLTFSPGQTIKTITVVVNGDTVVEPNESFFVNLTSATNATIADGQGVGTIVNDDGFVLDEKAPNDFDGDGRTDIAVYRNGAWFILRSSDGGVTATGFGGLAQDIPVPADYDGDGKTDIAVYRIGTWFILRSSDGGVTATGFGGLAQDVAVPADYDGDGKTDIAVYRNGTWFILRSSDGGVTATGFGGLPQDVPVPADYDGDGKTDVAVYRNGTWFILRSSDGGVTATGFGGLAQDVPVPADYDGDGKTDIAVYRNGTWFILRSSDGGVTATGFGGLAQDVPVPADYDGDGKTDIAVYRNGTWFILRSSDGGATATGFGGLPQDIPLN